MLIKNLYHNRIVHTLFPLITLSSIVILLATDFSIKLKAEAHKINSNEYKIDFTKRSIYFSKVPKLELPLPFSSSCKVTSFDYPSLVSKIDCPKLVNYPEQLDVSLSYTNVELFTILLSGLD
jgi:hypothetical protein